MPPIQTTPVPSSSSHRRQRHFDDRSLRQVLQSDQYLSVESCWSTDARESQPEEPRYYITEQNLRKFWRNHEIVQHDIERALQLDHATRYPSIDFLKEFPQFHRIACILIAIDEIQIYTILPSIIAQQHGRLTDSDLPWRAPQGAEWLGTFSNQFYDTQFFYLDPIDIGRRREFVPHFDHRISLPFVSAEKLQVSPSSATSANLLRVKVKKSYLHLPEEHDSNLRRASSVDHIRASNDEACVEIVCKIVPADYDLDSDTRNNSGLFRRLRKHVNVVSFIDVIHRGSQLHLFYPLPQLGDLHTLFASTQRHVASSFAPKERLSSLIRALAGVVDALCHLLKDQDCGSRVVLNVTPRNILIYHDPNTPFGRWKLCDFRIISDPRFQRRPENSISASIDAASALQSSTDQQVPYAYPVLLHSPPTHGNGNGYGDSFIGGQATAILGNVYINMPTSSSIGNYFRAGMTDARFAHDNVSISQPDDILRSQYRAPELEMGSSNFGEKSNVWSIGCIFIELLALNQCFSHSGCGNTDSAACLHVLRRGLQSGPFFTLKTFLDNDDPRPEVSLHDSVGSLLRNPSYEKCVGIAQHALQLSPDGRCNMSNVSSLFATLLRSLDQSSPIIRRKPCPTTGTGIIQTIEQLRCGERAPERSSWPIEPLPPALRSDLPLFESSSTPAWRLRIAPDHVLLCITPPQSATDKFWIRYNDSVAQRSSIVQEYRLPSGVDWGGLELNGQYGSVYAKAAKPSPDGPQFQYLLFDIQSRQSCTIPAFILMREDLLAVVPARTGLIAFAFQSTIVLRPLEGSTSDPIVPYRFMDFEIVRVAFNEDGQQLFVYILQNIKHMVQVWNVGAFQRPHLVFAIEIESVSPHLIADDILVLPSNHRDACVVVHPKQLLPILVQQKDKTLRNRGTATFECTPAATVRAISIAADGTYLVVVEGSNRKYKVKVCEMHFEPLNCSLKILESLQLDVGGQQLVWVLVHSVSKVQHKFRIIAQDKLGNEYRFTVLVPADDSQAVRIEGGLSNSPSGGLVQEQHSRSLMGRFRRRRS